MTQLYLINPKTYQLTPVNSYTEEDVSRHGSPLYRYWCRLHDGSSIDSMIAPVPFEEGNSILKKHLNTKINLMSTEITKLRNERQLLKVKLMSLEE
ncbi:coil containing protein [Vibrio phage 1.084.O._10N.261.49.F5]|nr:coil containing protein [Vibrio phage 1.084.O._10N.261.49.F5]